MDALFISGCIAHNANSKLTQMLASWDLNGLGQDAPKSVHGHRLGYLALVNCQNRLSRGINSESWMAVKAKKTVAYG